MKLGIARHFVSLLKMIWPMVFYACPIVFRPLNSYLTQFAQLLGYDKAGYIIFFFFLAIMHVSAYCYINYIRAKNMEAKLNEDFKNFLKPVPGKGYCIDSRFNEPVCPTCAKQDKETFLHFLPARFTYAHDVLMCDVCKHIIGLDTCAAKEMEAVK